MKQVKMSVGLLAAMVALAACTATTGQDESTSSTAATTTNTPLVELRSDFPESGPVDAGTYHIPPSEWSVSGVTMTVPQGWETQHGYPGVFKPLDPDGEVGFYFVMVDSIYSDPCVGSAGDPANELMEIGPSVDDLVSALMSQPHTVTTGPIETTLAGLPATRIDLTVADDGETATCNVNLPGHLQIWHSRPVDKYFVLLSDGTASVYVLDIDGQRQVLLTQHQSGSPADNIAEMQTIIDSIALDSTPSPSEPEAKVDMLPDRPLPGTSPHEPGGVYGWTSGHSRVNWLHKVIEDRPGVARQTQFNFRVRENCFVGSDEGEPAPVTVAGIEGLYVEPYGGDMTLAWSGSRTASELTTGAYALPIADRTLCVYLRWDEATTDEELKAARDIVNSIRGTPFEEADIRINFTLPAGWDTG